MPTYEYSCQKCGVIEIFHSIKIKAKRKCPECGSHIKKLVSCGSAFIMKGKQANQYNDIKMAKAWRDKNGNLHPVRPSDGHSKSPTVPNKITRSPQEISAIKRADARRRKKQRNQESYGRFKRNIRRQGGS